MADPADLSIAAGLPALPGSLWSMLAKMSWANPDIVRAHHIPVEAAIQGVAGAAGTAVAVPGRVVGRNYFMVRRITGSVEQDVVSGPNLEEYNSFFCTLQIEDQEHKYTIFRDATRMSNLVGVGPSPQPTPFDYEEPLVFLPQGRIVVTFTPLLGFPIAASALTGLTTRITTVDLQGVLVNEKIVERLLEMNDEQLRSAGLVGKHTKE